MRHRTHYLILPVQMNHRSCVDCKAPHEQPTVPASPEDVALLAHGIASQPPQAFDLEYESVLRTLQQGSNLSFALLYSSTYDYSIHHNDELYYLRYSDILLP